MVSFLLLIGGGLVYGFRHQLGISADTSNNVIVTVNKSSAPAEGAFVSIDGKSVTGIDPDAINSSGVHPTASSTNKNGRIQISVFSGTHDFSAGFPPDCGGKNDKVKIPESGLSVKIDLTCGKAVVSPTPTSTSSASAQVGHIRVFVKNEGGSSTYGQNDAIVHFKEKSGKETTCKTSNENGYPGYCRSQNFPKNTSFDVWATYNDKTSVHQTVAISNVGPASNPGVNGSSLVLPKLASTTTPTSTSTTTPTATSTVGVFAESFDYEFNIQSYHLSGTSKINEGPVSGVTADIKINGVSQPKSNTSDSSGKITGSLTLNPTDNYSVELSGPGGYNYSANKFSFTKTNMAIVSGTSPAKLKYTKGIALQKPAYFNLNIKVIDQDNKPIQGVKAKLTTRGVIQFGEGTSNSTGDVIGLYTYNIDYNSPPVTYSVEFTKPDDTSFDYSSGNFTFTNSDLTPGDNDRMKYKKDVIFKKLSFNVIGIVKLYGSEELIDGVGITVSSKSLPKPAATTSKGEIIAGKYNYQVDNIDLKNAEYLVTFNTSDSDDLVFLNAADKTKKFTSGDIKDGKIEVNLELMMKDPLTIQVRDSADQKPITGARVTLYDRGCPPFKDISKTTISTGKVSFYDKILGKYLSEKLGCSGRTLHLRIDKEGYFSRVYSGIDTDRVLIFDLEKIGSDVSSGESIIKGAVESESGMVSGAKITARKIPATDEEAKIAQSDSEGQFKLQLAPGKYEIDAFHIDYADSPRSRIYLELKAGEKIKVKLILQSQLTSSAMLTVLEKSSKAPVAGASVINTESKGSYVTTSDEGLAWVIVYLGRENKIRIEKNGKVVEQTFSIPKEIRKLDQRKMIVLIDDPTIKSVSNIRVNVKDVSGHPIKGASVFYKSGISSLVSSNGYMAAKTGENGAVIASKDFKIYSSVNDFDKGASVSTTPPMPQPAEMSFKEGQQILFRVMHPDYYGAYQSIDINRSTSEVNLVLKRKDVSKGSIIVYSNSFMNIEDISLKKKNGNKWNVVDKKSVAIVEVFHGEFYYEAIYYLDDSGEYMASSKDGRSSESINYDGLGPWYLYLMSKPESLCTDTSAYKVDFGNSLFFLFENKSEYEKNKDDFQKMADRIKQIKFLSTNISPLVVTVGKGSETNADAMHNNYNCPSVGLSSVRMITLYKEFLNFSSGYNTDTINTTVITHEYGHQVYFREREKNSLFYQRWKKLYDDIMVSSFAQTVWDAILDGNIDLEPMAWAGHPWDNEDEMFATFYSAYFNNHSRLHGIINYHLGGSESQKFTQNVVKYMWQLFAENVGSFDANDSKYFYPVGGKIGNASYGFNEIKNGQWLKSTFNSLSLLDQSTVQYRRIIQPILDKVSFKKIKVAVDEFNAWLDDLLSKMSTNTGSVSGSVKFATRGDPGKVVIRIGPRVVVSDESGKFTIDKFPVGRHEIYSVYLNNDNVEAKVISWKWVNVSKGKNTEVAITLQR